MKALEMIKVWQLESVALNCVFISNKKFDFFLFIALQPKQYRTENKTQKNKQKNY